MTFTRQANGEYTFDGDSRFHIVPVLASSGRTQAEWRTSRNTSGEFKPKIKGWYVRLDGAALRFSPQPKLADAKAWVEKAENRQFAVGRATDKGYVIAAPNMATGESIAANVSSWQAS